MNTTVALPSTRATLGHVLLGCDPSFSRFVAAGVGSVTGHAYAIVEYGADVPGNWRTLAATGNLHNLQPNRPERVEIDVQGQAIKLAAGGVVVLEHVLDRPLDRAQIGLMAQGAVPITFGPVSVETRPLSAFIVMQFSPQYDELFEDVIKPVCGDLGVEAYRASDIYRPGVIVQDIIQGLAESWVVIADITPANPNVFYELGYSHALNKPTVLLANRDETDRLPFDLSGFRVIFYDNTIRGKTNVELDLRQHLSYILHA